MIRIENQEQLSGAIERARQGRLFVQQTSMSRQYRVTNRQTGTQYIVDFFLRQGRRFGHCTCKGGQSHRACKHLAAALGLHLFVAVARAGQTSH
jgi:uncharacterized Zn finger protein